MLVRQNDWDDLRNEFSAVLFRLSYRTNQEYRSGYRGPDDEYEGDDEQRIIRSMRGWWEIDGSDVQALADPAALGVQYAVAFHQGRTRAVVQIDGWHWVAGLEGDAHHLLSVDDFLHGSQAGGCESGPLEDERWRNQERVRWAFDASPAPDRVHQAWVNEGGTEVSGMRRDTIVSVWPYSLADDQRDLVDRALRIFGEVLQARLVREFGPRDLDWLRQSLRDGAGSAEARRELGEHPERSLDPELWLKLVSKDENWHRVRDCFPSFRQPSFFRQLLRMRHRWAHFAYREQVREREIDNLRRITGLLNDIGSQRAASNVGFIRRVLETHVQRREADEAA
ncbi:hypothetical protein [Candidatus Poriferisodalis sp.]|uniref:hypothetical protein n=1 Tax=Candidatus Poriferisodalis sp. TaxID=3101277 RepID=UPI003C6ED325